MRGVVAVVAADADADSAAAVAAAAVEEPARAAVGRLMLEEGILAAQNFQRIQLNPE